MPRYMTRPMAALGLILCCVLLAPAQTFASALNWCEQAQANLSSNAGKPITCAAVSKRCVQLNNYWCQKHGASPWKGTRTAMGADGHQDLDGHAIFESADWSARAIAMDIRAKYRRGLTSAMAIATQYSPWCDTHGSKAVVKGSGRGCKDGGASPPINSVGPICQAPKSATPTVLDCKPGCNCPPAIAATLLSGIGDDPGADLKLFDTAGRPQPNLARFLRNLAIQEQGIYVSNDLIARGLQNLNP